MMSFKAQGIVKKTLRDIAVVDCKISHGNGPPEYIRNLCIGRSKLRPRIGTSIHHYLVPGDQLSVYLLKATKPPHLYQVTGSK